MPKGVFSEPSLEALLDAVDESVDIEVWIPEPVLWEWAEHRAREVAEAVASMHRAQKALFKSGVAVSIEAVEPELYSVERVVEALDDQLRDIRSVRILRCAEEPAVVVAGLRDQVLQLGPATSAGPDGKRVKTGAADSTSFRLIEAAAGDDIVDVVLVSNDQDARVFFRAGAITIVGSLHELKRLLLDDAVAGDAVLVEDVRAALELHLNRVDTLAGLSAEGDVSFDAGPLGDTHLTSQLSVTHVSAVDEVVGVMNDRAQGYFVGEARLLLDVEKVGWTWNDRNDELTPDVAIAEDQSALLQFSAQRESGTWHFVLDHLVYGG